jgi:hypothetical protein
VKLLKALGGGLAGACALTVIHEVARRNVPNAPRMDVLGMRAIAKSLRGAGATPPEGDELHNAALAGDLLSNSLYYSLVGVGSRNGAVMRGALLGAAAGVGAVTLPGPLGLGEAPSRREPETALMTIAWYLAGGLAAGAAYRALAGGNNARARKTGPKHRRTAKEA